MKGRFKIFLLLLFIFTNVNSQHLIGLSQEEVISVMKESNFVIDNSSRNTTFNYLKYVDRFEDKTFLVFLSKDNKCTATKLMCDYSSYKKAISDFNKKYKKISSTEWNYKLDGITYKVILKKEEWFYSVIVTPKNK